MFAMKPLIQLEKGIRMSDRPPRDESRDEPGDAAGAGEAGRTYVVRGHHIQAPHLTPGLYIVATPIGNLSDVTIRALDTLAAADLIACEDTRVTRKLLSRYGIQSKMFVYNDYSDDSERDRVVQAIQNGQAVALVSDAGTPLISDPGYRLVNALSRCDLPIVPIPGPSSLLAALVGAGLPTDNVQFAGFAAGKAGARRRQFADLALSKTTLILLESPHRLAASLSDAADIFGGETIACVCRELTKLYETFDRACLADLAEKYRGQTVKGEIVLLIQSAGDSAKDLDPNDVDALLEAALAGGSVRHAADQVAAQTGMQRRLLYRRALQLRDSKES
jgi:16S rRNA (cytidine1402-2'-O)-methyltransferase